MVFYSLIACNHTTLHMHMRVRSLNTMFLHPCQRGAVEFYDKMRSATMERAMVSLS